MKKNLFFVLALSASIPSFCMAGDLPTSSIEVGATSGSMGSGKVLHAKDDGSKDGMLYDFQVGAVNGAAIGMGRIGAARGNNTIEGTLIPDITPISWTYGVRVGHYLDNQPNSKTRVFVDAGSVGSSQSSVVNPGRGEVAVGIMSAQQLNSILTLEGAAKTDLSGRHLASSVGLTAKLGQKSGKYLKLEMSAEKLKKAQARDGTTRDFANTGVGLYFGQVY